jgi:large subunit ribosomal protein L9
MKIILNQSVENLGNAGDIAKVADGYARNYLIPKGLASEADSRNIKAFEHQKKRIMVQAEKDRKKAEELSAKLGAITCTIARRSGEQDKLFGSVGAKDIQEALSLLGFEIDKRNIVMDEPFKSLGEFPVRIKTGSGTTAEIKVAVVSEG